MLTSRERAAGGAVVALLGALAAGCAARVTAKAPGLAPPAAAVAPPRNPWSDSTRDVLAVHCGRCHRRDLPTAVPGALAVFDLLDEPWFVHLRDEQFDTMLVRLRAIEDLPAADLDAVTRFAGCARDGRCDPGDPQDR